MDGKINSLELCKGQEEEGLNFYYTIENGKRKAVVIVEYDTLEAWLDTSGLPGGRDKWFYMAGYDGESLRLDEDKSGRMYVRYEFVKEELKHDKEMLAAIIKRVDGFIEDARKSKEEEELN